MSGETSQEAAPAAESPESGQEQPQYSPSVALNGEPEVGSGEIEQQVKDESGLTQPLTPEQGQALDEAAGEIQDAIDAGASEEEVQHMIKKYNLKVFGEEKEFEIDLNDDDAVREQLQWAAAGRQSMQKAAEYEKQMQALYEEARRDPWKLLQEVGHNPDELAEERIERLVQEMQKSPEQLAQEEKDAELEALRREIEEAKGREEAMQFQQLQAQYTQDLNSQILDSISSTTELPKTPFVVRRIATAMLDAYNNGFKEVAPNDVVPWVEKEYKEEINGFLDEMPDELLEKYIAKNVTERLRKNRIQKNKGTETAPLKKIVDTGRKSLEEPKEERISVNEFLKRSKKLKY